MSRAARYSPCARSPATSKPAEQSKDRILATPIGASYVDGKLLFMSENTLMVQSFDATTLKLGGSPVPVIESVASLAGAVGLFSVSDSDVLIYRTGASASFQPT